MLVRRYLEEKGYILYVPVTEGSHSVDAIAYKNGKFQFGVEVKTKPMYIYRPETGFDYRHYERYKQFSEESNLPVLVSFVDETKKEIYGNYLHELDKPISYNGTNYPKNARTKDGKNLIRYYPAVCMKKFTDISEDDAKNIRKYYSGSYGGGKK